MSSHHSPRTSHLATRARDPNTPLSCMQRGHGSGPLHAARDRHWDLQYRQRALSINVDAPLDALPEVVGSRPTWPTSSPRPFRLGRALRTALCDYFLTTIPETEGHGHRRSTPGCGLSGRLLWTSASSWGRNPSLDPDDEKPGRSAATRRWAVEVPMPTCPEAHEICVSSSGSEIVTWTSIRDGLLRRRCPLATVGSRHGRGPVVLAPDPHLCHEGRSNSRNLVATCSGMSSTSAAIEREHATVSGSAFGRW